MKKNVRVRFAPSPTGHLHIGNARTAILNWIVAKHYDGKFVLRIEDTDVERSSTQFEQEIFEDLAWLGLHWDEGPDVGGPFGPYRQSERLSIYAEYLEKLKESGDVYPCYCTEEELEAKRQSALKAGASVKYDGTCRHLTEKQRQEFERMGRKPVWRFKIQGDEIQLADLVKGDILFEAESFGDFVIMRSDGIPTYNFAATIDDALMKITHVIRGDDHVSNTPKQILLYQALGWPVPQFAHIPMILGPDRTRLSKRHGATSVREFRKKGYLPEALINFLSLLSWSSETGEEILSKEQIIKEFDFNRMSHSPAIFDVTKLNWMNGYYIRAVDLEMLFELARPYLEERKIDLSDKNKLLKILRLIRDGIDNLSQIPDLVEPFFEDIVRPADGQAIAVASKDSSQKVYWAFLRYLHNYDHLDADIFRKIMKQVQKETGVMGKDLWMPIRVALTGRLHGPDLSAIAEILGKEKCDKLVRNLTDY